MIYNSFYQPCPGVFLLPEIFRHYHINGKCQISKTIQLLRCQYQSQQKTSRRKSGRPPEGCISLNRASQKRCCRQKKQRIALYHSAKHDTDHRQCCHDPRISNLFASLAFLFYMHVHRSPPIHSHMVSAHHRSQQIFPVLQSLPRLPYGFLP